MYYPKSQIKTNLYSNGDYILSTTLIPYTGYYYETSQGTFFTGKTPNNPPNIKLFFPSTPFPLPGLKELPPTSEITFTSEEFLYSSININPRIIPQFNPTIPTTQDQQNGQFTRYFCKKTNELTYIEIDQNTYQQLIKNDSKIAWDLYNPTQMIWIIKGDQTQVFNSNKSSAIAIEQNLKWHGFSQYFQNKFLKYYESLNISNLYTSGGEFKTKNGQEYIGFYHIHNGTIPMVGKTHIKESHETLISIKSTITSTTSSMTPFQPNNNLYNTGGSTSSGGSSGGGGGY